MKHLKYILIIIPFICMFCSKDLSDYNENPNNPDVANESELFKYSLIKGAGSYNSDVSLEQWSIMNWIMYLAARGGVESGMEYKAPGGKDAFWEEQYADALNNIQEVINQTSKEAILSNKYYMAKIWKVFLFHRITDLWGKIPYTDALKGFSDNVLMPEYTSQDSIYYNMLIVLKEASEQLDINKVSFDASSDMIYNGNIQNWIAFSNSLQLRLATRIKYADYEKYQTVLADLINKPLIESNEQSALFPFNNEFKNHIFESYYRGEAVVQNNPSHFLVELLKSYNDPRISVILEKAPLSSLPWIDDYKGIPNLLSNTDSEWENFDDDWGDISNIGNWFLQDDTPGVLISYSEVCFLKAEAALEGLWQGSAQQFYEEGIKADILFYNSSEISNQVIDDYLSAIPDVNMKEIITQKWISFVFENGYEAYAEYRRTGFPELTNFAGLIIDENIFPKRLIYPVSETNLNRENYNNVVQQIGGDLISTKVWWDNN